MGGVEAAYENWACVDESKDGLENRGILAWSPSKEKANLWPGSHH